MGRPVKLANWGNHPVIEAEERRFRREEDLRALLAEPGDVIPRGLGRCYGDSSLNGRVVATRDFDRMLSFDGATGLLTCEAGVSLAEIVEVFAPRGWFLPVTPGTKFVTVGGAVASDVHGKNHHKAGSLSRHVARLDVMLADGTVAACSADANADLFRATCGGMGLTGMILRAAIRLVPVETAWIRQETVRAEGLDRIMDLFEESSDREYSVAWIDCLSGGRSVMIRGEHARRDDLPGRDEPGAGKASSRRWTVDVPFPLPGFVLNGWTVRAFNSAYFGRASGPRTRTLVDIDSFFFPLDFVRHWNRIYGPRGLLQYQFVVPKERSRDGLRKVLGAISRGDQVPFLTVLKLFGRGDEGLLSFPIEGYTLALDFPVRDGIFEYLDRLDSVVLDHGGRIYLTKDARMRREVFEAGYPAAERFRALKRRFDPGGKFQSLQSRRLGIA